jgi:hypothetical protein
MLIETAAEALRTQRLLELRYPCFTRRIEVHAVGYSKRGRVLIRGFVQDSSRRGERRGWKLLDLFDVLEAAVSEEPSKAPRRGYRRNDAKIERIVGEL